MSLRSQLILAFVLIAVLPLTGLTVYSYWSSIAAFKKVVEAESATLAEDAGKRMELATRDLNQRVDRLGNLPFLNLLEGGGEAEGNPDAARLYSRLMEEMGDAAFLVDSFEFRPTVARGLRESGRHPVHLEIPDVAAQAPRLPPQPPPEPAGPGSVMIYLHQDQEREKAGGAEITMEVEIQPSAGEGSGTAVGRTHGNRLVIRGLPRGSGMLSAEAGKGETESLFAQEKLEKLDEVSRGLEARTAQAVQALERGEASARRRLDSLARKSANVAAHRERIKVLLDTPFNCPVEASGQTVGTVQANVNPQMVLHDVLMRTRRNQGEIPFAVDSDGNVYTPNSESMEELDRLKISTAGISPGSPVQAPRDWVVVTRREPRFGLTFGIARPVGGAIQEIRNTAVRNLGYGLAMVCVAMLGILPLSRRMTRNLTSLSTGAERLAGGDLNVELPVRSRDEFGRLAETFNRMARELKRHQRDLVDQERLKKELEMCRQIQEEMLPRVPLRLPLVQVRGVSIPAWEVGGDFFNYFPVPGERVAIVIGDVSGKGVPAALLMANVQATLRARLSVTDDLASLAGELDHEIYAQTPAETYLTLFMGLLDSECRNLTWVNAGHTPQFSLRPSGDIVTLPSTGRPLGLVPGGGYECRELSLSAGDSLFLYTDGLVEAQNAEGDDFGLARLEAVLADAMASEPDALLIRVEEESLKHRAGAEAADDATMMVLRVAGPTF